MKTLRIIFLAAIFISACSEQAFTPKITDTLTVTSTSPATSAPLPTDTPNPTANSTETPESALIFTTSIPLPLQLIFPTPPSQPRSIWRPPLYQQPFALSRHDHFYFSRPITVDEVNWPLVDYRYGYMASDSISVHTGIDIDVPLGTPIVAAAPGTVIWAGYGLLKRDDDPKDPYGLAVMIRHDFGFNGSRLSTVYAHMSKINVKIGEYVEQGQTLGLVGLTGNTTGPHVHFEVRLESSDYFTTRNPELWLSPPEGDGLIVGQFQNGYGANLGSRKVTVITPSGEWITGYTYGPNSINSDEYYQENFVQSDLPAGTYQIEFTYLWTKYTASIKVYPGIISYFTFMGRSGFVFTKPNEPDPSTWLVSILGQ